jgi:hypothetical protein
VMTCDFLETRILFFPFFELLRKMLILDGVSFSACLLMVDWKIGVSEFRGVRYLRLLFPRQAFSWGLPREQTWHPKE